MHQSLPLTANASDLRIGELSLLQQVLLVTDGTLTNLLELYTGESIHVVKLAEVLRPAEQAQGLLKLAEDQPVMARTVVLQGRTSQRNWLYAESLIVPERLDPHFQARLLHSHEPIGKLWLEQRVETFKEQVAAYRQPANGLGRYFGLEAGDELLCRTYLVFSQRQPVMLIAEKFPVSYFV